MSENLKVLRFAVIVCLACSVLVSTAALGLRDRQEANLLLDVRKNILKSVGQFDPAMTADEVNNLFQSSMVAMVVNKDGEQVDGVDPLTVGPETTPDLRVLYRFEQDGQTAAYTFPIEGKGLWSTVYGYLALESDLDTVRGITFYKHGETPGLGGEVEKDWFQKQWIGKTIHDAAGDIVSVTVVKGHAAEKHPNDLQHYVDGISGATITSHAVSVMVRAALDDFEPYFAHVRQGRQS